MERIARELPDRAGARVAKGCFRALLALFAALMPLSALAADVFSLARLGQGPGPTAERKAADTAQPTRKPPAGTTPSVAPSAVTQSPGPWRYYGRLAVGNGEKPANGPPPGRDGGMRPQPVNAAQSEAAVASVTAAPRPLQELGFPDRADPLFDRQENRPAYILPDAVLPQLNFPHYVMPALSLPLKGQDPYQPPAWQMPMMVMPTDNLPSNEIRNEQAPAAIAPSAVQRTDRFGPNYVIKPEVAPADNRPTFDPPPYGPREYAAPVALPPEYVPERLEPPPFLGPPR